jgi:ABC-type proline/glycine betaine transport system ATPase subunit
MKSYKVKVKKIDVYIVDVVAHDVDEAIELADVLSEDNPNRYHVDCEFEATFLDDQS